MSVTIYNPSTISRKVLAPLEFDGNNRSQKGWGRGNERLLKISGAKRKQLLQIIRLIGNWSAR